MRSELVMMSGMLSQVIDDLEFMSSDEYRSYKHRLLSVRDKVYVAHRALESLINEIA